MKVQAGQFWKSAHSKETWFIIRVANTGAYGIMYEDYIGNRAASASETLFGTVDENSEPCWPAKDWNMVWQGIEIKVGQVLENTSSGEQYIVKEVTKDNCGTFGSLFHGYTIPNAGWENWPLKDNGKVVVAKPVVIKSDFDFFKQPTQSGYCVCNIPKSQCDYHR